MNPIPVIQKICGFQHHNNNNSICPDTIGARSPEWNSKLEENDVIPHKSRILVIKKGKVTKKFMMKIQGDYTCLTSIVDTPVKCLGKRFGAA